MSGNPNDRERRRREIRQNIEEENNQEDEAEAEEDFDVVEDVEDEEVEEPEGEDLLENQEQDYQYIEKLDKYEADSADLEDVDQMEPEDRMKVEDMLNERDRIRRRQQAREGGRNRFNQLLQNLDSEDDDQNEELQRRLQQRQEQMMMGDMDLEEQKGSEEEDAKFLDHTECKGKLSEWIKEPRTERWIRQQFKRFLINFKDENGFYYQQAIREMCINNHNSLEIKYAHLIKYTHAIKTLSIWISFEPQIIFPILNQVALGVVLQKYPNYEEITGDIYVKIAEFVALDNIRDLRQRDIGKLIRIEGVVTKRTGVFSQLKKVSFVCNRCYEVKGPFFIHKGEEIKLGSCAVCQSKGPFSIDKKSTIYRNYQKITIQESPGKVPPGRVPRQKDVVLLGNNIDSCKPGDEVSVTGIYTTRYDYQLNVKHGFPLFYTVIEANNIKRMAEVENLNMSIEDENEIKAWSKKPRIFDIIYNSIGPSIHKHEDVKIALALAMFGGVSKDAHNHKTRGDINVLILGDPGTAKSQFLKSVEKTFRRAVYTTGKGASAVGLTASVRRDPQTKEWTLEGGALVLADKGICLIDEFDKMNDHDRTSIHEAMEQQSISISKAGIVATLQARCSVIAAANPIKGRYDSHLSFMDNVDLTDPILSRFDILCVVKDEVSQDLDSKLAKFVINSHMKSHPFNKKMLKENPIGLNNILPLLENNQEKLEMMPQELLKKYIMFARQRTSPKITDMDTDRISKFYQELRSESNNGGGMPIAVRHLESIIRMSESHARMHLRNEVRNEDVDVAISVLLRSFIKSQKFVAAQALSKKFRKHITQREDSNSLLYKLLERQMKEQLTYLTQGVDSSNISKISLPHSFFEDEAKQMQIHQNQIMSFYDSEQFKRNFIRKGDALLMNANLL